MGVEALIAQETAGLLRRRPSKLGHIFGLNLIACGDCELSRTGRATYFFMRYMDDLLDGDRTLSASDEPLNHVAAIRSQIETGIYTGDPEIMKLAEYSLNALQRKAQSDDNPRQDCLDLIDIMLFDHQRRQERQTLTAEQLTDYYRKTFSPINNLLLIGLQSELRSHDIPEFSLCQGRVYSAKHLQSDWQAGIINIPAEVLHAASLTPNSAYEDVDQSFIVRSWIKGELQRSKTELSSVVQTRFPLSGKLTRIIYKVLAKPMLKFIDRYSSNH